MCQTPNVETGFHVCVLSKVPCTKENDKKCVSYLALRYFNQNILDSRIYT